MLCPNCGFQNLPGAKFCSNCGNPLAVAAQAGATAIPASPDLTAYSDMPAAAGVSRLAATTVIPPELAEKLQAARASRAMVGERRVVTMLFCDVKGSTAAAETLDPEEWTDIMNGAFENMIRPVYEFEGTEIGRAHV